MSKKAKPYTKLEVVSELVREDATSILKHLKRLGVLLGFEPGIPSTDLLEKEVDALDLQKVNQEELNDLFNWIYQKHLFSDFKKWLLTLAQRSSSKAESRLEELINRLEAEFPIPDIQDIKDDNIGSLSVRLSMQVIIKTDLLSSFVLYALDMNGPAIIELHSILERFSIEKLNELISLPPNIKNRLGIPERYRLQELASMLQDYKILDEKDVEFAKKLSKLRDGLAHRNIKKISDAAFSGQSLDDIDLAASEVDYISLAVNAIPILIKLQD